MIFKYVFAVTIYFEFLCKIIAMGFVIGTNTYLKLGWNIIEFIVVIARFKLCL